MHEDINKPLIDAIITPSKVAAFIKACFPDCDKVKTMEAWKAYSNYFKFEQIQPCRSVFFYVMQRDGWTRRRYQNTNYFLRPGYTAKRGRPTDSEIIVQLKNRIAELETENRKLKKIING